MTWKQDLYNTYDLHNLFRASKRDGVQMQGDLKKVISLLVVSLFLSNPPLRNPQHEELGGRLSHQAASHTLHPYRESAPYFSFLQLALAICLSIIYTFTHFREQGTVMQLNSKKHKH